MKNMKRLWNGSIEYYTGGVKLHGASGVKGKQFSGGVRGKISGWSRKSRARFRLWLVEHEPIVSCVCVGATFTLPGPTLSVDTAKDVFANWARRAQKRGVGGPWRAEVQKRGQLHWHCLVYVPCDALQWKHCMGGEYWIDLYGDQCGSWPPSKHWPNDVDMNGPVSERWLAFAAANFVRQSWRDELERLGPFEYDPPVKVGDGGQTITHVGSLNAWPSARRHSVDVQTQGATGAWKRYLQDHCTKAKQEQIGVDIGRAWGVINRKMFEKVSPVESEEFPDDRSYYRFLRAYRRLCTPQLRDKRPEGKAGPFPRRLGRPVYFGVWGQTVKFSRPETIKRLASWSKTGDES